MSAEFYVQVAVRYDRSLTYVSDIKLTVGDLVLLPPTQAMTGAGHKPWKARIVALGRSSY